MVHHHSLEAFERILPKVGERQAQILALMRDLHARTDAMISWDLRLPINCITNRRGELVKKGCIEQSHKDHCKVTGGKATYWKITQCGIEVNNFRSKDEFVYGIE